MNDKTISIEDIEKIANVKIKTIKKNASKIPGLIIKGDSFEVLKGTRYPGDFHRYKMENSEEKRYVLLKAISEYKYIDHLKLHIYEEEFKDMLHELLDAELIRNNNLYNHYGANAYSCTIEGEKVLKGKKCNVIKKINEIAASAAGHFVGGIISEVKP